MKGVGSPKTKGTRVTSSYTSHNIELVFIITIIIIITSTIIIIVIVIIGMASVNVACCSAIVLNYYAANVGFTAIEKQADAEKFVLS